jgi:DNA-binding CsgD family transcriptional regulator
MSDVLLPASRVRELLRLLGEMREILDSGGNALRHAAEGLLELVGADAGGFALGPRGTLPGDNISQVIVAGFPSSQEAQVRRLYVAEHGSAVDPAAAVVVLAQSQGTSTVARRYELVDDRTWYGSDFVNAFRRPWRLDDSIYGAFHDADERFIGVGCFRSWGSRNFNERERALAQLFVEECTGWILQRGQRGEGDALTPRQRETLRYLLEGNCAKEIASKLGLSLFTVKEYVKAVYRANGVTSQAELMARLLTPSHRRPVSED